MGGLSLNLRRDDGAPRRRGPLSGSECAIEVEVAPTAATWLTLVGLDERSTPICACTNVVGARLKSDESKSQRSTTLAGAPTAQRRDIGR